MSLKSILASTPKTAWVNLPESPIEFEIKFISRARFRALTEASTILKYDVASKVHRQSIDGAKLVRSFLQEAVTGWKNVTPRNLKKFVVVNEIPDDQMDKEVDFNIEDLVQLIESAHNIDSFVQEACMDPQVFNVPSGIAPEEAAKN